MELIYKNISYQESNYSLTINSSDITGITGKDLEKLEKILSLKILPEGNITIDKEKITRENINNYRKIIAKTENIENLKYKTTVAEYLEYIIKKNNLTIKNATKKIIDSLKIVGLNINNLTKDIKELSTSEQELLKISISLLSNPEVIILKEPFHNLDLKNQKKLNLLLTRLKDQYNKVIIIISNNSNQLYKYTNKMIFIKDNKVLLEGNTKDSYMKVDYLIKNKFSIPEIVYFTYIAKKTKKIKIDYHKDIRDIIKDIYKHV